MASSSSLLDAAVWGDADLGPLDPRTGVVNRGSHSVAGNLMRWFRSEVTIVQNPLSDGCELLAFLSDWLASDPNRLDASHDFIGSPATSDRFTGSTNCVLT